jgi:hypothetical protein
MVMISFSVIVFDECAHSLEDDLKTFFGVSLPFGILKMGISRAS